MNAPTFQAVTAGIVGLFPPLNGVEERLSLALYGQLSKGRPVTEDELAQATDLQPTTIARALSDWHGIYRDSARRVIGYWGLTISETRHRLRVDGRSLYTWCAWDTLFIPELLGISARVESSCPVSGDRISLTVNPDGAEPDGLRPYVSFLAPDPSKVAEDVVRHFCHFIHFFATERAGADWVAQHPGTLLVTLEQAWDLGRRRNALLYRNLLGAAHRAEKINPKEIRRC